MTLRGGQQDQTLIACVADGAGSSRFSEIGSAIACPSIVESAVSFLDAGGQLCDLSRDDVLRWCDVARARIEEEAAARDCKARDLATTLCVAIVSPACSCFFQIGDGAIVLRRNRRLRRRVLAAIGRIRQLDQFPDLAPTTTQQLEFIPIDGGFSDIALDDRRPRATGTAFRQPHSSRSFFRPIFPGPTVDGRLCRPERSCFRSFCAALPFENDRMTTKPSSSPRTSTTDRKRCLTPSANQSSSATRWVAAAKAAFTSWRTIRRWSPRSTTKLRSPTSSWPSCGRCRRCGLPSWKKFPPGRARCSSIRCAANRADC